MIKNKQLIKCKRCGEDVQNLAVTRITQYTICWDCVIEVDINGKKLDKYEKRS